MNLVKSKHEFYQALFDDSQPTIDQIVKEIGTGETQPKPKKKNKAKAKPKAQPKSKPKAKPKAKPHHTRPNVTEAVAWIDQIEEPVQMNTTWFKDPKWNQPPNKIRAYIHKMSDAADGCVLRYCELAKIKRDFETRSNTMSRRSPDNTR